LKPLELKDFPSYKWKLVVSNLNEGITDDEVKTYFRVLLAHLSKPIDMSWLNDIDEEDPEKKKQMLEASRKDPI